MAESKKPEPAAKVAGSEKPTRPVSKAPAKAPAKFSARAVLILLVLLLATGGGGYLTWPHWYSKIRQQLPQLPPIEDARVGGLVSRVEALESVPSKDAELIRMEAEREKLSGAVARLLDRVNTIEEAIGAVKKMAKAAATAEEAAQASAGLKRLNDRLTRLESAGPSEKIEAGKIEKRITEAEAMTADQGKFLEARVTEAIGAIEKRVDSLVINPPVAASSAPIDLSTVSARQSAMVLAVAQLRRTAESGQPYKNDLDVLSTVLSGDPTLKVELDLLAGSAATGLATIDSLRRSFDALAGELAAKAGAPAGKGWFDRAVARLSSLVRIRRVDGRGAPDAADTIIAGAEADLVTGKLASAVEAVERLVAASPSSQAVVGQWLAQARARLAVDKALTVMHVRAISLLAPASPAKE